MKSWLFGKESNAGKDRGQGEKGKAGDVLAGVYHRLNGHRFGWTPGVGDGQTGLACCSSWGCKESDTSEWLNWTDTLLSTRDGGNGLVIKSCLTVMTPWNVPNQAPLLIGFSRQEYWSGLPFPSPGDRHNKIQPPWRNSKFYEGNRQVNRWLFC